MRTSVVGIRSGTYSFISYRRYSARLAAQIVIMVVLIVVVKTDPLLLVLLYLTFIVSTSLERPNVFFLVAFPAPARALFWEASSSIIPMESNIHTELELYR